MEIDNLTVLRAVSAILDDLEIVHAVGGSWASGLYGEPRFTRDADISVEPFPGKETLLVRRFEPPDYYVNLDAVRQAVRERSTFNIIHVTSGFKVDLFVRKERAFERSVLERRSRSCLPDGTETPFPLVSPEDIILLKLEWYRLGGEISDRQWSDVLGVLRVQAPDLDRAYLTQWAEALGVRDLLDRAVSEADSP